MLRVRPLEMGSVGELGPRARRCAYWETDLPEGEEPADPEFEKEAWISHVLLEWGVCGQFAESVTDEGVFAAGAAFYAPPGMVPRAGCFPTGPVGADAVLLTGFTEEPDAAAGVRTRLLREVVLDLRSRGVKAVETFGLSGGRAPAPGIERQIDPTCDASSCVTPTAFLVEHGFTVVAEHERHPRLRLEIDTEHLWKADVERALDQLFADRGIATRRLAQLAGVTALSRGGAARSR